VPAQLQSSGNLGGLISASLEDDLAGVSQSHRRLRSSSREVLHAEQVRPIHHDKNHGIA
jgi:hypothetical protein